MNVHNFIKAKPPGAPTPKRFHIDSYTGPEAGIIIPKQEDYTTILQGLHRPFCGNLSAEGKIAQPDGTIKKKRIYESFTCDDPSQKGKRRCEKEAADWAATKDQRKISNHSMTFEEALNVYIKERSAVLSPASIRKYKRMADNCMLPFKNYKLKDITQDIVQNEINLASAKMSPKSVRDMHGLFSSVMARFCPEKVFRTALPKKVRPNLYVPTDDDIQRLIDCVIGTEMEIPVYLAAFGALHRGEISALEYRDINGNVIHVHRTMVLDSEGVWITKAPKSYAGDRYVAFPQFVTDKLRGKTGLVTPLRPNMITARFEHVLKRAGLPHFRFHDLRHPYVKPTTKKFLSFFIFEMAISLRAFLCFALLLGIKEGP